MPPPTPHQTLTTAHLTLQTLTSILTSTPASTPPPPQLLAELSHYKELFSQLRFSYLEQVTKEKFLRSIASDPPTIYDGDDNALLEADLRDAKESLKEKKREVQEVLDELEAVGGRLADGEGRKAYEQLTRDQSIAQTLPAETETMNAAISAHESGRDPRPELNLPLSDTLEHISAAESELRMLQTELENLQAGEPRKKRNLEGLEREIAEREREREGLERFASEAVRAREGARREGKAERENTGQWYKSSAEVLGAMLQLDDDEKR